MPKRSEAQDTRDKNHCLDVYGPSLRRCKGGRLVVDGFICPHCDSDNPSSECAKPLTD